MRAPRIVSLIASATETAAALGLLPNLVGRSHECDYPPVVQSLPQCSRPKIDFHTSSYRIDQQIRSLLRDGLAIYEVDVQRLRELRPDVILTQTHCEVCAVSEKDVQVALCEWLGGKPKLVSLHPDCLADVWQGMQQIADACDVPESGRELVKQLQERLRAVGEKCRTDSHCPTLACIEWVEPLMVAGNWTPELVQLAHATDVLGKPGRHSPRCSWEQLRAADPEVILISPCGYDLPRTQQDMPLLEALRGWGQLRAVTQGRVYLADGNAYFNRPGPRLVETLEILAQVLHPTMSGRSHEVTGWQHWQGRQATHG